MPEQLDTAEVERQEDLIAQDERAGNLKPETAARYRADLIERGISFFDQPGLDGPNAAKTMKRWQKFDRAFRKDAARARAREKASPREAPAPPVVRGQASARSPRRSLRTSRAKARAPDDPDGSKPPLQVVPHSCLGRAHTFCREHRSWFCPCFASWIYERQPWKARAWFQSDEEEAALPEQEQVPA